MPYHEHNTQDVIETYRTFLDITRSGVNPNITAALLTMAYYQANKEVRLHFGSTPIAENVLHVKVDGTVGTVPR